MKVFESIFEPIYIKQNINNQNHKNLSIKIINFNQYISFGSGHISVELEYMYSS